MSDIDVNKIQQNVKELQDQNAIDFQQWKKLGKDIEKLSEKIKLSDTNLNMLMKKIKNDYEKMKKIIVDENIQVQLNNKIEQNKNEIVDNKNKIDYVKIKAEENTNKIEENKNEINKKVNIETFENKVDEISSQLDSKTSYSYVDNKISGIVSGSPKGQYNNLGELQSAFPTGTTGIYITLDNGNWNYWNGSNWTSGGVYQATSTDYNGVKGNTNLISTTYTKYGEGSFSISDNIISITNNGYGGILNSTILNVNNFQNLYLSMLLKSEKEVYMAFFDTANGYKGAIQIPTNSDGYVIVNKIITVDQIKAFNISSNFKIGFLTNSIEWKIKYLTISSTNYNQDLLQKEFNKIYTLITDNKAITDNSTKTYSQVVETNNLFKSSNMSSYGSNTSFSIVNELITIKNSGYGGVNLGTFNLSGADYLYVDCIIKSQKAVDLGIMDTSNGFKGAIRLSNGSAKDIIYKDKIAKSVFVNYGLTGNFKLVLLSSSLDWSVKHLLISNKNYSADNLSLEIKKLDDTIKILKDTTPNMNYIYVSSTYTSTDDGFGETKFNNLVEANNSIKYNSKENPYTIIVKNGTYSFNDIYSGNTSTDYQGIVTKDYVYYESENINRPDLCIIEFDGATGLINPTDSDIVTKAPFHIAHVSTSKSDLHTHIKGFTFKCKNTRYCMHIETQMRGLNVDWLVENCVFDWYGRPDTSDNTGIIPCVGMGMSPFETGKFKNCNFNNLEEGNNIGLMVHDNIFSSSYNYMPYMVIGAKLTLENCKFNGTDIICNTGHYNEFDTFNIINIINVRGINTAKVGLINGQSNHAWRSNVKCSEITNNQLV